MADQIAELNTELTTGNGDQPKVLLRHTSGSSAEIYLHGATVTSFIPASGAEVFFLRYFLQAVLIDHFCFTANSQCSTGKRRSAVVFPSFSLNLVIMVYFCPGMGCPPDDVGVDRTRWLCPPFGGH